MSGATRVRAEDLARAVADMFAAAGVPLEAARQVADDLVAADLEGVPSHGVMLVPMYVERIRSGSVSRQISGEIVSDRQTAIVIDAGNVLGQLTARQAVELAAARAEQYGTAVVAIRNAFHFGAAGRYARMLAERGFVGMVMCNTRPLMPPVGGATPTVGNNPIAIAAPGSGAFVPEVDMAMSAAAMGKIRNAAAAGQPIPLGWATDKDGADTTDPEAAISGMLLPAAGPKGFGLAFMIDLLCGGLSGGGLGEQVRPLFGMLEQPYGCANLFIAINVGHFLELSTFQSRTQASLENISGVRRAPGVERVFAPGELAHHARSTSEGWCLLALPTVKSLQATARSLGVDVSEIVREEG